ncbi:hypothetical protein G6L92_15755 [Agrobacterium rhizogenes]|nr:hypothetical protein [Rhizobium rhizogenes]
MDPQEIFDALEATTGGRKQGALWNARANASRNDILNHRDSLLRFLEEIDGDISVADLREALEDYR